MAKKKRQRWSPVPPSVQYEPFELLAHFDGGITRNPGGTPRYGYVIYDVNFVEIDTGKGIAEAKYPRTNNTAEFTGMLEALGACMRIAKGETIRVRGDSQLAIYAMLKHWNMKKSPHLAELADHCRQIVKGYCGVIQFEWVPRERNARADQITGVDNKEPVKTDVQIERGRIVDYLRRRAEESKGLAGFHLDFTYTAMADEIESLSHHGAK